MTDAFEGTVIADKYRVDTLLRKGDKSNFYIGRHVFTEKPVILEILPASAAAGSDISDKFSAQARIYSRLSHPNILGVSDFGSDPQGDLYIAYEGAEGELLANAMAREGQVPASIAIDTAVQIAKGLAAAHNAGLVHGNLDPGSILVSYLPDNSKQAKIFDFGSSNALQTGKPADAIDVSDLAYLSPELCSGAEFADERSDIYSVGVILYEMLAGSRPFNAGTPGELMAMHTEELPPPLSSFRSDLPENVESVALTAMAVDPDARYHSAAEMAEALELAQQSVARPKTAAANPWKTLAFVVAGILLLSAFLIYATWMKRTDPATVLQPDANGLPVQPINPATGAEEQSLAVMPALTMDANSNVNSAIDPGMYPGGDSYNPWAAGGAPPPGAPPIGPPGSTTTVVTSPGNPFNPPADCPNATWVAERNAWLCDFSGTPPTTRPTPTPRPATPANANTATQPAATPTQRPTAPAATPRAQPTRAAPSGTATPPESDAPIERDQR